MVQTITVDDNTDPYWTSFPADVTVAACGTIPSALATAQDQHLLWRGNDVVNFLDIAPSSEVTDQEEDGCDQDFTIYPYLHHL